MPTKDLPQALRRISIDRDAGCARIEIPRRRAESLHALVDINDLPVVGGYLWRVRTPQCMTRTSYAETVVSGKGITMHRLIAGAFPGEITDHINGDGLDNRSSNLRIATRSQNVWNRHSPSRNATGFFGVQSAKGDAWSASINHHGITVCLGTYMRPEDAALAYDIAVIALRDEHASTNFCRSAVLGGDVPRQLIRWPFRTLEEILKSVGSSLPCGLSAPTYVRTSSVQNISIEHTAIDLLLQEGGFGEELPVLHPDEAFRGCADEAAKEVSDYTIGRAFNARAASTCPAGAQKDHWVAEVARMESLIDVRCQTWNLPDPRKDA